MPRPFFDTKVGKGKEALVGKSVTLHYTGWLYDASAEKQHGKKFDSSGKQPFVFPLGDKQVIRGWDEGIVGMKAGGKRTLIIPAEMAYGARGARDGQIPPNSTLIFDVELLAVK